MSDRPAETVRACASCREPHPEKGRAMDGRRAYRCRRCSHVWTEGRQDKQSFSTQRTGYQFADTGAGK